jgi:hypothetical protein
MLASRGVCRQTATNGSVGAFGFNSVGVVLSYWWTIKFQWTDRPGLKGCLPFDPGLFVRGFGGWYNTFKSLYQKAAQLKKVRK